MDTLGLDGPLYRADRIISDRMEPLPLPPPGMSWLTLPSTLQAVDIEGLSAQPKSVGVKRLLWECPLIRHLPFSRV